MLVRKVEDEVGSEGALFTLSFSLVVVIFLWKVLVEVGGCKATSPHLVLHLFGVLGCFFIMMMMIIIIIVLVPDEVQRRPSSLSDVSVAIVML